MQPCKCLNNLLKINNFDSLMYHNYRKSTRSIYVSAFSKAPWFESVTEEALDEVFQQALRTDSIFMGAFDYAGKCNALLIGLPIDVSKINDVISGEDATGAIYLSDICTDPSHQGSGIGRQLLAQFEEQCISTGFEKVFLRTHASCEWLCNFYLTAGYEKLFDFNFPLVQQLDGVATGVDCIRTVFCKSLPSHKQPHRFTNEHR